MTEQLSLIELVEAKQRLAKTIFSVEGVFGLGIGKNRIIVYSTKSINPDMIPEIGCPIQVIVSSKPVAF